MIIDELTGRLIDVFGVEAKKQRKYPRLYKRVDGKIIGRYVGRKGSGCFDFSKPSESKRCLPESDHDCLVSESLRQV